MSMERLMKGLLGLIVASQLLALSACSQKTSDEAPVQVVQAGAVFSTSISPEIIDQEEYLQVVSTYNDFKEMADKFRFNERGFTVFDESYFKTSNVIIVAISTAPGVRFSLNRITRTGSKATVNIEQQSPKSVFMSKVVVCMMIGIKKDDADGISNYTTAYEKTIIK